MPGLARQMALDGTLDLNPDKMPEYIRIIDNQADTTIFVFSGLDVLFAGYARYEFGQILRHLRKRCNFVFLRDVYRMVYHVTPDGEWTGVEFYRKKVEEAQARLGAKHNIALGSSTGGTAAFYYGTICNMNKIIVFGPTFPHTVYTSWTSRLRSFFNLRMLLTEPRSYIELIVVTLGAVSTVHSLARNVPQEEAVDVLESYRQGRPRPPVTLFYGKRCRPDSLTARILSEFPEVKLVALDTGRHNTPEYLNKRGELGPRIVEEVEAISTSP